MSAPALPSEPGPHESTVQTDGRRAARERNRLAVVDALLDLYAEGNLRPDAQEVAARSGVSRRSVFRYFDDRDDLDRTAIERQQQRVWHLVEIPAVGEGPLDARIARIAEQRVALFRALRPAARVARLRAPFYPVIAEQLEQSRQLYALQVELQFAPELNAMAPPARAETLAAADASCSFETYDFLGARGLDPATIAGVMRRALTGLFGGLPAGHAGEPGSLPE
jgi:AcrR family transcriptional regulator